MKLINLLLTMSGFVFLGFGLAGIGLPILPTTPFVLLSAACFSAGSPRFYRRLLRSRLFGPYLENYRTGQGISGKQKISAIVFLWMGLAVSMLIVRTTLIYVILGVVGIAVSVHLLTIKTKAG